LVRDTSEADVEQFERAVLEGGVDWLDKVSFHTDHQLALRGKDLFQKAIDELQQDSDHLSSLERSMRRYVQTILRQRHLMCIGSFRAPVRVNEFHRVLVGVSGQGDPFDSVPISAPAFEGVEPGEGEGSVEFFMSRRQSFSVLTVSLNGQVVCVFLNRKEKDETLEAELASY
jgi:hypothetical protein